MQKDRNSSIFYFDYMKGSLPPWKWLGLILLALSIAVILFLGMGKPNSFFYSFVYGKSIVGEFKADPFWGQFMAHKIPLFYKLVSGIYEIPFYHLLIGVLVKAIMVVSYFYLAWRITRSSLASVIAVLVMFGLLKFEIGDETILNLKLPFVPDSMEIREWIYLSYRQVSAPFIIIGTIFFLNRKFILSSILLGLAVYSHPHSGVVFFVGLNAALLICIIFWKNRSGVFVNWVKFAFPFLIIILPYWLSISSAFQGVEPMPFNKFWELGLINEPDDLSILWSLVNNHPPYLLSFYLTLSAIFFHFLFKVSAPKIKFNYKTLIRDDRDILWPVMIAPWVIVGFACLWELGLMAYLPDFLNDQIALMHLRRINMISGLLYMPIFSMLLASIILLISEKLSWEIFGDKLLASMKCFLKKIGIISVDSAFAVGLSIAILFFVILIKNKNMKTFTDYWEFEPVGYEQLLTRTAGQQYWHDFSLKKGGFIAVSSFVSVCNWIKNNTSASTAFFNPPYIRPFRTCSKRQGFLEEKMDGNVAIADRKFATIYYERLADISRGFTYYDLQQGYSDLKDLFPTLRQRYLSLDENYVEFLKEKYPEYRYFLTEASHGLPYPIAFKNAHFILYDLLPKF